MNFLLDTNICSSHIRRPAGLAHRFMQHSGGLWMSSLVLAELYAGAYMLDQPDRLADTIDHRSPHPCPLPRGEGT
jgi:tRNA(fMet)-specific endonuclease VapC